MKTSNILLITAVAAYLLIVGLNASSQYRQLESAQPYADSIVSELATTEIHTLIAEGDGTFTLNIREGNNNLRMASTPTKEQIRIMGDTLFVCRTEWAAVHLPGLENFMLNDTKQRLPSVNEWHVTYRHDRVIDSLLIE